MTKCLSCVSRFHRYSYKKNNDKTCPFWTVSFLPSTPYGVLFCGETLWGDGCQRLNPHCLLQYVICMLAAYDLIIRVAVMVTKYSSCSLVIGWKKTVAKGLVQTIVLRTLSCTVFTELLPASFIVCCKSGKLCLQFGCGFWIWGCYAFDNSISYVMGFL